MSAVLKLDYTREMNAGELSKDRVDLAVLLGGRGGGRNWALGGRA